MDIERIVVHLMADATQYNRVVYGAAGALNEMVRDMRKAGGAVDQFFSGQFVAGMQSMVGSMSRYRVQDQLVRTGVLATVGALAGLGIAAGLTAYEGLSLAASYERAAISFEVMAGSAERGKQMLEDINQLALTTPFRSTELISGARQLKAFGVETSQVIPALEVLGDVSAGTGTSLHRLTLAFGQVMTVGHLTGQELRQFNNAGVPLAENLAAVMNKPLSAIQHLVRTGQVSSNDVIAAFNRMTQSGGTFQDMMVRLNDTVPGQWNTLFENVEFLARNIGLAFFEGVRLKDVLKDVNSWLSGVRDATNTPGRGGLVGFFASVRSGFEWVYAQAVKFKDTILEAFSFPELSQELGLAQVGEDISAVWSRVKDFLGSVNVTQALNDFRAAFLDLAEQVDEYATYAARVGISVFRGVREEAVRLKDQAATLYGDVVANLPAVYELVVAQIKSTWAEVKMIAGGGLDLAAAQMGMPELAASVRIVAGTVAEQFGIAADRVANFSLDVADVTNQVLVAVGLATAAFVAYRVAVAAWSATAAVYVAVTTGVTTGLGVLNSAVVAVYSTWAAFNAFMNMTVITWAGVRAAAVSLFSGIVSVITGGLGLMAALPGVLANLMVFLGPGLALGGIVAALVYSLDLTKAWRTLVDEMVSLFRGLGSVIMTTWEGFSAAVKANEMQLAWEIAFKGIELAWQKTVNAFRLVWLKFKSENLEGAVDSTRTGIASHLINAQKEMEQVQAYARFQASLSASEGRDRGRYETAYRAELDRIDAEAKANLENLNAAAREATEVRVRGAIAQAGGEAAIREAGVPKLQQELDALVQQAKVKEQMVASRKEELKVTKEMAYWEREASLNDERAYHAARKTVADLSASMAKYQLGSAFPNTAVTTEAAVFAAAKFLGLNPASLPGYFRTGYGVAPYNPANAFGALTGGVGMPTPPDAREYLSKLLLPDPKVTEFADKLNKTFEDGITEAEKLGTHITRIFQARGVDSRALGAAAGGIAAALAGATATPQVSPEVAQMALMEEYKRALNYVKDELAVKQPPALTVGSAQAMDAINKANLQQRAENLQVIDVLKLANQKHDRQIAEAKRVADAMEKAAQQGVVLVPKKLEPRK